jgi:transposase InsO family protein
VRPSHKTNRGVKDFMPLKAHELWVADITYIPLKNRFAYLFLITDAHSRKIVGFHISDYMEVSSATLALKKHWHKSR